MSVFDAKRHAADERRARAAGLEPWQLAMTDAVSDDLLRDIVRDSRRRPPNAFDPMDMAPAKPTVTPTTKPYRGPAGTAVHDRMVDAMMGVTPKRGGA
jgi:hypothetical protein